MLEPRYSSSVQSGLVNNAAGRATILEATTANHNNHHCHTANDTAVDLSRKSSYHIAKRRRSHSEADVEDSDEDAPLDLKVRHPSLTRSRYSEYSPDPQQLLRIAELCTNGPPSNLTPLPPTSRDSSQERDHGSCQYCGTDRNGPDYEPSDHKEGFCNKGSFACTICAKTFTVYSEYDDHKQTHQKVKQRQYPCLTCGKIFTSASNRNMHQRIHKGVRPFQCNPCGVFFRQKAHLQKHQKTQGHIQATEIFDKKKKDGYKPDEQTQTNDEEMSLQSEDTNSDEPVVDSTQSFTPPAVDISPSGDASPASSTSPGRRYKSSPKRKQARPQYLQSRFEEEEEEEEIDDDEGYVQTASEAKIRSLVDYNDQTHGYECTQCAYSSHDLSVLKEHVRSDHLTLKENMFKCIECQIGFSQEFNMNIHKRKHEVDGHPIPCEDCSNSFKTPNKLIKHMENDHDICSTCGEKLEDKISLAKHMDQSHSDQRKGFHSGLLQFTPLTQLSVKTQVHSAENRAAKMRKVDNLAEVIRQKQLQQKSHSTSALNGNEVKSPLPSPLPRRRKNDLSSVKALLGKAPENINLTKFSTSPFLFDPSKFSPMPDMIRKSENNNILSSLKLPPSIKLPTQPVAGLTPPSSPPPSHKHRIHGELSVTIVPTNANDGKSEETCLDLSVGKRGSISNSDENEVSTTARDEVVHPAHPDSSSIFSRLPEISGLPPTSTFPPSMAFPFPFPGLLPPVPPGTDPALTEHFLKLSANLPRSLVPSNPVLSAMLAAHPTYQPAFPGMAPGLYPPSSTKQPEESSAHKVPPQPSGSESKPFNCSFCRKEFSHLSSLESHMEHMHSGESKHVCDACGKNFSSKSNLTAHRKIHSGERPFECPICHKRFRQKAHLQKHETTHSSATPYQCNVCDKAFGHPSNLNTHMATHSNIRPYHCSDCGKSYKDSASFKRHCLSHSNDGEMEEGERHYICNLCPEQQEFENMNTLRQHREVLHPNAGPDQDLDSIGDDEEEEEIDDVEEDEDQQDTSGTSSMLNQTSDESLYKRRFEASSSSSAYSSFNDSKRDENRNETNRVVDSDVDVDGEDEEEEADEVINKKGRR